MEKTRTDLLNHLAKKYNLERYLEIGVQVPEINFDKIICKDKVGVDPEPSARATVCCTSDEFFKRAYACGINFDLVFLDGLHTAEQVQKDFDNAVQVLRPGGIIVMHDCNPLKEEHALVPRPTKTGHWNGDVYRFALYLTHPTNENRPYVVDIDNGCLVFSKSTNDYFMPAGISAVSFEYFDKNRKNLLNLISWDEFVSIGSLV